MPLLSEIEFASISQYAVRSADEAARQRSKAFRDDVKRGRQDLFDLITKYIRTKPVATHVRSVFGSDVVLVPAPGSAPHTPGALWVPDVICKALLRAGLAASSERWLTRLKHVPKSAFAPPDQRPDAFMHYETISAVKVLAAPARIVVVDDVVTRGCTLLASVSRIAEEYPHSQVSAFALTRAISHGEIDQIPSPAIGTIALHADGSTSRAP